MKLLPGVPLRFTAAIAFPKSNLTHVINFFTYAHCFHSMKKKTPDILSYALEKSSFRNTVGCLDCLAQYKLSWVSTMLSSINRSGKNAVCSGLITSPSIGCSLVRRVLAKKL